MPARAGHLTTPAGLARATRPPSHRAASVARLAILGGSLVLYACGGSADSRTYAELDPEPANSPAEEKALLQKAEAFHRAIHERHITRRGLFLLAVDLDDIEAQLRDDTAPAYADTPTYTGLFAATSCLRARVETGAARKEARSDAERALAGLTLLMEVTGRPGLLARGVQTAPAPPPEFRKPTHRWFDGAPPHTDLAWRGDVSQDQYANGLLPAVAACHELFPEVTRRLVVSSAELLSETQMQLIDPDGRRTLYGDLSPSSGFGWNSIAKLTGYGIFALAADLDPDPRWLRQQAELRDRDEVVASSTLTNLRVFGITNYSNDLMAWNLYRALIPVARRQGDPAFRDLMRGLWKAHDRVAEDRNPYFQLVECALTHACEKRILRDARATLLRFPLEKRRLAPSPELAEIPVRWLPGRKGRTRARYLVPIEIRPAESFEWKANPYRVRAPTAPDTEYTGLDYLAAYWVYRFILSEDPRSPAQDYL